MNTFTSISRRQALRRFFAVFMALVLLSMTVSAVAQPILPGNYVTSLNWSEDGSLLAYGTGQITPPWGDNGLEGGTARVLDQNSVVVFALNYPYAVGNVEISPTGSLVFVGPFGEVFDLATQQVVVGLSDSIAFRDGIWHPTSDLLLLTAVLGARVYDPLNQETLSGLGRGELPISSPEDGRTVTSVWSPDGLLAATSTTIGFIYIWDATRGVSSVQTTFSLHAAAVQHLVWNAATNLIASGDDDGRVLVWNPDTGNVVLELTGHTGTILDIDWSADGTQIATASLDNTLRVWDWPSGESVIVRSGVLTSAVAYNPDGSELAYGGEVIDPNHVEIDIIPVPVIDLATDTPTPTVTPTFTPTDTPTPTNTLTPTRTPTPTPTPIPLPPANTNLLTNPSFASGLSPWQTVNFSAGGVVNGVLEVTQPTGVEYGVVWQSLSTMLPADTPMSFSVALGNSSAVPKRVQVILRASDWANAAICEFVLPANSALASYSVRVRTAAVWNDILAQVWTYAPDGLPAVRIDNADLQYQPGLTVNTTPDCLNQGGPILVNGQFALDTAGWSYVDYTSFAAVSGQLQV